MINNVQHNLISQLLRNTYTYLIDEQHNQFVMKIKKDTASLQTYTTTSRHNCQLQLNEYHHTQYTHYLATNRNDSTQQSTNHHQLLITGH